MPDEKRLKESVRAIGLLLRQDEARRTQTLSEVQLREVVEAEDLLRGQHGATVVEALLRWRRNAGGLLT